MNFGDSLPAKELALAAEHARGCDLMLVLGSSLVVEPAASLVGLALQSGARAAPVNRGETPYDDAVPLRVRTGIGDVLPPAVERVTAALAAGANNVNIRLTLYATRRSLGFGKVHSRERIFTNEP